MFAIDPETGKQRWVYDPVIDVAGKYGDGLINRGVAAWLDPKRAKGKPCRTRVALLAEKRILELSVGLRDYLVRDENRVSVRRPTIVVQAPSHQVATHQRLFLARRVTRYFRGRSPRRMLFLLFDSSALALNVLLAASIFYGTANRMRF